MAARVWSEQGIKGSHRFLRRVWDLVLSVHSQADGTLSGDDDHHLAGELHRIIRRVTQDLQNVRFNTMIAALMEFTNLLNDRYRTGRWRTRTFQEAIDTLLVLLAPPAPHIVEELWQRTGHTGSSHRESWPAWDERLVRESLLTIAVQVNGRVRDRFEVPADTDEATIIARALALPRVRQYIGDPAVARVIYVPGRLINITAS
jgi:leucyl-tRNA synthetase